jgi:hypothetical protein
VLKISGYAMKNLQELKEGVAVPVKGTFMTWPEEGRLDESGS